MVCSIGKLYAKVQDYAQDNYYTKNEGLENSQWYGQGAVQLGLKGKVLTEDYSRAYQGVDSQGNPLRQRQAGKNYNPGRDVTLSAPKSVSLLGLVKEDTRVIEAQKKAVTTTLKYIESNCIFTRTGKGGVNRQQTDNALIAIFHHDDNRNQDPQLHSHCVIFNQSLGADGKWRSMDNRELYQQKMTIGMVSHEQRTRKTAIVIDELGALNQLPSLHRLLSESRKFLGCPILGTQTEAQITKIYGREDTRIILQGTKTKLILNCADPQTAETMAKIIGKQESVQVTSNRSRSTHRGGQNRTVSENEQIKESYAVLPAQLQDLPDLRGYFKIAGLPAAAVRMKVKKFPKRNERFVSSAQTTHIGQKDETIQQQWQRLRF
jgi:hypothetical protein